MPSVITCTCGAKVRLPAVEAAQELCCPRCKAPLAETSLVGALRSSAVSSDEATLCPICQSRTAEALPTLICPGCQQVYHQECWDEIGGCGTYGCSQAPAVDKSEQSVQAPLSAWGDNKKCPACGETIKAIAVRCRYCGTDFSSVDPLSLADLHRQAFNKQEDDGVKKTVIGLFVVSLLGLPAPLTLLFGLIYLLPRRKQLARCGPLFVTLGYTSLALSGLYCLLIVAFICFQSLS